MDFFFCTIFCDWVLVIFGKHTIIIHQSGCMCSQWKENGKVIASEYWWLGGRRNGHQVDHQAGKKWHPTKIIPHSVMPPPPMLLRKSISGIIRAFPFVPAAIFPLFPDKTFTKRTQRGYNDPIRAFGKVTLPDLKWKCSLNLLWVYIKKKYIKVFAIFVVSWKEFSMGPDNSSRQHPEENKNEAN